MTTLLNGISSEDAKAHLLQHFANHPLPKCYCAFCKQGTAYMMSLAYDTHQKYDSDYWWVVFRYYAHLQFKGID